MRHYTSAVAQNTSQIGSIGINDTLVVKDDLKIILGENVSLLMISGEGEIPFRAFEVEAGIRFSMDGRRPGSALGYIEVQGGILKAEMGGAMYIAPGANVTLFNCRFRDSVALESGGSIYVDQASLNISGGSFFGESNGDGGGIYNNNGHIRTSSLIGGAALGRGGNLFNNHGVVEIYHATRSTVRRGSAEIAGGAIYSNGGRVSITNANVHLSESMDGGAIYLSGDATLQMSGVSIFDNSAYQDGGGIYVHSGMVLASQCTFSRNCSGALGSAVHVQQGDVTLINCTITENCIDLDNGAEASIFGSAIFVSNDGMASEVRVGNSIVAANVGTSMPDISGSVSSLGHNIVGVGDSVTGLTDSDLRGSSDEPINPMLTFVESIGIVPHVIYPPVSGSPAIDAGDNPLLSHPNFVGGACQDARGVGFPRIRDGVVDIGAIEVQEGRRRRLAGGIARTGGMRGALAWRTSCG